MKWTVLLVQAGLTLFAVALIHSDNRRANQIILAIFATSVGVAVVLIAGRAHRVVCDRCAATGVRATLKAMSTDMAPRFAVMGVLVVSLAACSQPMTETAATRADAPSAGLEGTSWNAVQVYGTAVRPDAAAPDLRPYLVFAAEGRVSGSDGCNRLSGRYTANGANGVTFGQMASTRMACPGHDDLAQQFQAALNGTNRWSIVQDRLEIYDAAGKPVAVFERRP